MKSLKHRKNSTKIRKDCLEDVECPSEQYPHITFRYLTNNDHYNFDYVKKLDGKDQNSLCTRLIDYFQIFTSFPWIYWYSLGKNTGGIETFPVKSLRFDANGKLFTKDEKAIVLRFDSHLGNKKARIIGFKDNPCSTFFVIGFDFDFSAYSHE